jgi:hypothetical protein
MEKHHMQGKIKPDDAHTEKQSLNLLFLLPQKVPAKLYQEK